jgi:hypothetical protein
MRSALLVAGFSPAALCSGFPPQVDNDRAAAYFAEAEALCARQISAPRAASLITTGSMPIGSGTVFVE